MAASWCLGKRRELAHSLLYKQHDTCAQHHFIGVFMVFVITVAARQLPGAYDTNLTVTGAYDHFAGSVICANIYIIAFSFVNISFFISRCK